ncbi:MAG: hypothetical protein JNM18_00455 [Planctomycetaceae bacterium]|nr:hypothetical protein [Planctomycetaceae bacterium]
MSRGSGRRDGQRPSRYDLRAQRLRLTTGRSTSGGGWQWRWTLPLWALWYRHA